MENASDEPVYLAQTGEAQPGKQARLWFAARDAEARAEGCLLIRHSFQNFDGPTYLVEGWDRRPSDQGMPRWQLQRLA